MGDDRMRTFCFQIQFDRLNFLTRDDVFEFLTRFESEWPEHVAAESTDDSSYVNLIVESNQPNTTWDRARRQMIQSRIPGGEFRNAMIVTATGEYGWDDYLLLHHYDNDEEIDTLP